MEVYIRWQSEKQKIAIIIDGDPRCFHLIKGDLSNAFNPKFIKKFLKKCNLLLPMSSYSIAIDKHSFSAHNASTVVINNANTLHLILKGLIEDIAFEINNKHNLMFA